MFYNMVLITDHITHIITSGQMEKLKKHTAQNTKKKIADGRLPSDRKLNSKAK